MIELRASAIDIQKKINSQLEEEENKAEKESKYYEIMIKLMEPMITPGEHSEYTKFICRRKFRRALISLYHQLNHEVKGTELPSKDLPKLIYQLANLYCLSNREHAYYSKVLSFSIAWQLADMLDIDKSYIEGIIESDDECLVGAVVSSRDVCDKHIFYAYKRSIILWDKIIAEYEKPRHK